MPGQRLEAGFGDDPRGVCGQLSDLWGCVFCFLSMPVPQPSDTYLVLGIPATGWRLWFLEVFLNLSDPLVGMELCISMSGKKSAEENLPKGKPMRL